MTALRTVLAPESPAWAVQAVEAGGGEVVAPGAGPQALVWTSPGRWDGIGGALAAAPGVDWVQLPFAGIEGVRATGVLTPDRTWTCAKGIYAEPVAEHALALALAVLRQVPERARTTSWGAQGGLRLYDSRVVVLGAGGITEALVALLAPFRADVTVVRRDAGTPSPGATRTVGTDALDDVLPGARLVVLALALTEQTEHVLDDRRLRLIGPEGVLVNVARGRHVDTDALVGALRDGALGGAGLDVTDPEPLPDGHPLYGLPTAIVTPHTANPWTSAQPLLAARITENVRRRGAGEPLLGLVDVVAGY